MTLYIESLSLYAVNVNRTFYIMTPGVILYHHNDDDDIILGEGLSRISPKITQETANVVYFGALSKYLIYQSAYTCIRRIRLIMFQCFDIIWVEELLKLNVFLQNVYKFVM